MNSPVSTILSTLLTEGSELYGFKSKSFSSSWNETLSLIAPEASFFPDYIIPITLSLNESGTSLGKGLLSFE